MQGGGDVTSPGSSDLIIDKSSVSNSVTETEDDESTGGTPLSRLEDKKQFSLEQYVPSSGPLLGSEEMEKYLKGRKAVIQVTTWNMGSLPLPKEYQLRRLFFHEEDESLKKVDIHVVAIQECWPDSEAWELALQTCLGPDLALFDSLAFGTLHISIFMKRDLLWFTTDPSAMSTSVRSGRLFKTKGAAGISFGFFGSRFLFISAHLSAGNEESRVRQRVEELRKILTTDKSLVHYDAIFLSGDLNFRIADMTREQIFEHLRRGNLGPILEKDELNRLFQRKDTIPKFIDEFQEAAAITFRPTYKYDLRSDSFDSSTKRRAPAYTDRIIYRSKLSQDSTTMVSCLAYESVARMTVSDHKPVYGVFSIELKPGFDTLPLSGARFKKEIYVKAVQQRAKFLLERRKKLASSVCNLS